MAKLIINPTSAARRELALDVPTITIGRDPANDLVLPDSLVSRRHAVIEKREDRFYLRDCNSSNGSLLNGERVTEHVLKDGDLLAIGTIRLLFREGSEPADSNAKVVHHPSSPRLACPTCGADHKASDQFCRMCGAQIAPAITPKMVCPSCATIVALPAKFCNVCGQVLPSQEARELEATRPRPVQDEAAPAPSILPPTPSLDAPPAIPVPPPIAVPASARSGAAPARPAVSAPPHQVAPAPAPQLPAPRPVPRPAPRPTVAALPPRERALHAPADETAGAGQRLIAACVDFALVSFMQTLFFVPILIYWWSRERTEVAFLPILLSVLLGSLGLLLSALYFVYFWGIQGSTPGKQLMGLVVADSEGHTPIGVGRAFLRLCGYGLSGMLLGIGFLMIPLTGAGLHDRLAGTRVIRGEDA